MKTHLPILYGNELARHFCVDAAPSFIMRPLSRAQLAVTRLTCKDGLTELSTRFRPEKAFSIAVHLVDPAFQNWGTWVDGKFLKVKAWRAGGIGVWDLESDPRSLRDTGWDAVHYNLPRSTLDAFTEDVGFPKIDTLLCEQGTPDPVLYHLSQMLLPSLGSHHQVPDLFFDHFVLMLCGRLVNTYSSVPAVPNTYRGGLAPWQARRARELLHQHLNGDLRLATLARECGLSVSHFTRSFRRSFGSSVHRYLILRRVETAKAMLRNSTCSLIEIALQSGFPDQAALSRTFSAVVGQPPGKWRSRYGRHTIPGPLRIDQRVRDSRTQVVARSHQRNRSQRLMV
jgi:AraC family transcriptional regulator